MKQIRKEGDELLARSGTLSGWASAFAIEASYAVSPIAPGRRGGTQGPVLPDAPLSEESEGSPRQFNLKKKKGKLLHHHAHHPVPPQLLLTTEYLIREQLELAHGWLKNPPGHGGTERVVRRHGRLES